MKYRDRLVAYSQILDICRRSPRISDICRKSNHSHYIAIAHLEFLENKGMIENLTEHESRSSFHNTRENIVTRYRSTEKGIKFAEKMNEAMEILA